MSAVLQVHALLKDAASRGVEPTIVHAAGSTIIVIPALTDVATELLPEADAARIAKCSVRALRAARRSGELVMFGKQRSRTVRRAALEAWIESRRVKPSAGVDDADIERRMQRLARVRPLKIA